jgi:2-aminoadipate transaminase
MIPANTPRTLDALFARRAFEFDHANPILVDLPKENNETISLAYGDADIRLFPTKELIASVDGLLHENMDGVLNYAPSDRALTELVATRLQRRGVAVDPQNILITYGSSQILGLLPQIMLNQGDIVIVEGPTFLGGIEYFVTQGATIETVPVGENGMDIDALEATLKRLAEKGTQAKFIYTIPTHHNPTGTMMPLANRKRLLALAATYGVLVLEDDAYGDLDFRGEMAASLLTLPGNEWVLHIGTFSKILAPGVRMAWAYGPTSVMQRLRKVKSDQGAGPFITRLVSFIAQDGWLDSHIKVLNATYARKYGVMRDAMATYFPTDVRVSTPSGGFFVYGYLPQDMPARELIDVAIAHGVSFLPGTVGYANGGGTHEMRLAFSFQTEEKIADGIQRLGAAMHEFRQRKSS